MDQKNKLNETYLPDKAHRKDKVVIGLSGGVDSYVTAYLLKIQKYELIGVTVTQSWDDYDKDPSKKLSCLITDEKLAKIKSFCHQLGIPHFTVNASQEFQNEVIESWMASHLSGTYPTPCWVCHDQRMGFLHHKMKELGAAFLATGHFAKIFMNENSGVAFVHTSNDEENDQSALLSRLPQEVLKHLLLPLSDLQKKEVLKLAENFGVDVLTGKVKMFECLSWDEDTKNYVIKKSPLKLLKGGELFENGEGIGDHEGFLDFPYGKNLKDLNPKIHKELFIGKVAFTAKRVFLYSSEYFMREEVILNECQFVKGTSLAEPLKGALKVGETYVDCWVFPKTINSVFIQWEGPLKLTEGDILTVLKKKGKNSKVFLTGKARFLPPKPIIEEGDKNVKVDYSRDY